MKFSSRCSAVCGGVWVLFVRSMYLSLGLFLFVPCIPSIWLIRLVVLLCLVLLYPFVSIPCLSHMPCGESKFFPVASVISSKYWISISRSLVAWSVIIRLLGCSSCWTCIRASFMVVLCWFGCVCWSFVAGFWGGPSLIRMLVVVPCGVLWAVGL